MEVRLSARMAALADMVPYGARLADVGTDHGYIPVFLCQTGKIPAAIAMDIHHGPLQKAEFHVAEYGLKDKISLRLSDGLMALAPGEADVILIAGMGGALIKRILRDGAAVLEADPELVLQPQSEISSVRCYLREIGYGIFDEDCVLEDGKFYFLIRARRLTGDVKSSGCSQAEEIPIAPRSKRELLDDAFGPVLLRNRHLVLRLFLEHEFFVTREICFKLEKQIGLYGIPKPEQESHSDPENGKYRKLKERLTEMEHKIELLETALRIYQ